MLVDVAARAALQAVARLEEAVQAQSRPCPDVLSAAAALRTRIERTLRVETLPKRRGRHGLAKQWTIASLRRRCRYLQSIVARKKDELATLQRREGHKLMNLTIVQVGLSDPTNSARSVEEHAREFNVFPSDLPPVGRTSVCWLRHAFARVLRRLCRLAARAYTSESTHGFVCFRHLHDEASMRMRSFLAGAGPSEGGTRVLRMHRSRSSKVQNNSCTIHIDPASEVPWLTELQPLARKDADTLCYAIFSVLEGLLAALGEGEDTIPVVVPPAGRLRPRLIHILVGGLYQHQPRGRQEVVVPCAQTARAL